MTSTPDDDFHSITGVLESAEPTSTPTALQAPATAAPSRDKSTTKGQKALAAAPESESSAAMQNNTLAGARSLNASGSPSSATTPLSSRDASPARPNQRPAAPSATNPRSGFRSRRTSTDVSPSRASSLAGSTAKTPSAAAIQRALSATSIPELPPASSSDAVKAPRPLKAPSNPNSGDNTPHWPISPRLRSPPPGDDRRSRSRANSLRSQIKKPDAQSTPAIVVQSSSPASLSRFPVREEAVASDPEEPVLSMKGPSRGASGAAPKLETVQESSLPATPGFDGLEVQSFVSSAPSHKGSDQERNDVSSSKVTEDLSTKPNNTKNTESGSDSATKHDKRGKMQEQRASSAQRPNTISSKASLSSLSTKSRDPPLRNMTVETETVPSVAQATIGNQDRSASGRVDGSLRLKPSNETIRPKKERKPPKRKAPSINSGTGRLQHLSYHYYVPSRPAPGSRSNTTSSLGSPVSYRSYDDRQSMLTTSPPSPEMRMLSTQRPSLNYLYSSTNTSFRKASSKADVFEQKVASAVDEADSSDSDATFIYESNPPEQPHRSRHHHSRTPSMTSIASLADPRLGIRDTHKNPNKKSSMKFTNPYNNPSIDGDALERGEGTMRIGSGRVSGGSHHHHIGRHGQGRGALSHLVLDSDTSMAQSSRARGPSSRQASQPNSPRFVTANASNGYSNGSKKHGEFSMYDMDAEHAADDERTPLIPTRSPRVRTPRRRNSIALRQLDRRHRRDGGWCRRFAGCLVLSILLLVVIFSSVGLVFATTKPLTSVMVRDIQNVVASQEEIMLELIVNAVNPNIIGVTVSDMDVIIFAKSKHVGSDTWWREHGNGPTDTEEVWQPIIDIPEIEKEAEVAVNGVDEGTDPIEGEPRTMSLGRIFHFDSPLNFDGSFFQRHRAESIGEIRLSKPGNKTEAGGTERWEEVLQYPFELVVQGNFKYTLPLSTREHKVPIRASYYYDPDLEKKKLLQLEAKRIEQKKHNSVPSAPLGRYDRRVLPVSESQ
ncbi:Vacuolar inheritance and morphology protein [Neocucurbitaria cava]|uniref:Vacuolar inheritance and morphology protein n=1 Tax=Neocucurbitaria cava TaxID=798079 RepID=A0A9W9CQF9_9PLEO|nr:Vacuolar inheritance and morphology protein [Neocucurbitaria cava]